MTTSPITRKFLVHLVNELEAAKCCPILLRNYENFPLEIGNDLDVFVIPEKVADAYSILSSSAAAVGGNITHLHRRGYFIAIWIVFPDCELPVHIDLYHGALTWHGLPFLTDCDLVQESIVAGTVDKYRIPRPSHEALVSLLASVLWGGFFKSRYLSHISALLSNQDENIHFKTLLLNQFGKYGEILADSIFRNETTKLVNQTFSRKLRRYMFLHCITKRHFSSIRAWIRHWKCEAACYFKRMPGMVVEYDHSVWNDQVEIELRVLISPFFGDIHVTRGSHITLLRLLKIRRLRGKNHLVMIQGSRFAINGNASMQNDLPFPPSPSQMAELVTSVLKSRISLQYHQR
jgi:hypothetical protein